MSRDAAWVVILLNRELDIIKIMETTLDHFKIQAKSAVYTVRHLNWCSTYASIFLMPAQPNPTQPKILRTPSYKPLP